MIAEALIIGAAILLGLVVPTWLSTRRPKYLVTIQKTTDVNNQPEILSLQANLPGRLKADQVWEEVEALAMVGVARCGSVNDRILANNTQIAEMIEKRKTNLASLEDRFKKKQLRRAARVLGCRVDELTPEMIEQATRRQPVQAAEE